MIIFLWNEKQTIHEKYKLNEQIGFKSLGFIEIFSLGTLGLETRVGNILMCMYLPISRVTILVGIISQHY